MEEELDILPLLGTVAYPSAVTPLAVAQPAALRLLEGAGGAPRRLGVVALRDSVRRPATPTLDDCYSVGVLALVHRLLRLPDGTLRVAVEGLERIALLGPAPGPGLRARVRLLPERPSNAPGSAVARLRAHVLALAGDLPGLSPELAAELAVEDDPRRLTFIAAGPAFARTTLAQRQALLELDDPAERLALVDAALAALPGADDGPAQELAGPAPFSGVPGRAIWVRDGAAGCELAWVEAALLDGGSGQITVTGGAGAAARDAALVAISAVRGCAGPLSLNPAFLRNHDLHVHVPAGARAAERPGCAGAVALALAGLLAGHAPLPGAAIIGELSLHGRLLPTGRLAEKLIAAEAAGLSAVILSAVHADELAGPPQGGPRRIFADDLGEALAALL
jgi:ATP-dependent Lon protease